MIHLFGRSVKNHQDTKTQKEPLCIKLVTSGFLNQIFPSESVLPKPRSGETTLATGVSPWKAKSVTNQSRRDGTTRALCAAPMGLHLKWRKFHGLTPVARVVSPLRGLGQHFGCCSAALCLCGF